MDVVTVLLFFAIPLVIISVQNRIPGLAQINPIIPAYLAGLSISLVLPHTTSLEQIQEGISSAMVALAIPLMLFAVDIRRWARAGKEAVISFVLATVSIMVAVMAGHLFLQSRIADSHRIGGLLMGVYTGGTPNLAAIRLALNVDTSLYLTIHTIDLLVSALYILLILSLGKFLVRRDATRPRPFLVTSFGTGNDEPGVRSPILAAQEISRFFTILRRGRRVKSLVAVILALAVVAISLGISALFPSDHQTVVTILSLTTLALLLTLVPGVSRLHTSFPLGEFFILVFSVAVGSMADLQRMRAASPIVVLYLAIAVFGSLGIHFLLGRIFRIRNATTMVTSISAICSPPFVGMLAPIIKDPHIIAAGITTGIIGYALGNYLGVFTAWVLSFL